jgi:hypothetical protein
LSFHCVLYLRMNGYHCEGTPPLHCGIAFEKAASWVDACASGASYWSAPNNSWLSLLLLEELAVILCLRRVIDFPPGIHINLQKKVNNFDFLNKNSATPPLYGNLPKIFNPVNRQHICYKPVDFIIFLPTILSNSILYKIFIFYGIIFLILNWQ